MKIKTQDKENFCNSVRTIFEKYDGLDEFTLRLQRKKIDYKNYKVSIYIKHVIANDSLDEVSQTKKVITVIKEYVPFLLDPVMLSILYWNILPFIIFDRSNVENNLKNIFSEGKDFINYIPKDGFLKVDSTSSPVQKPLDLSSIYNMDD